MIRFHAFGVDFSLPLLTLITPVLCVRLGMKLNPAALLSAMGLHEIAHILAAKLMRVEILEIRLTPFGGSARMENPYGLRAFQLAAVAAAGPACNLLSAVLLAGLAQWNLFSPMAVQAHVSTHLMLFIFNLLPALPLDGGRLLFCLLQAVFSRRTAISAGLFLGKIIAAGLSLMSLFGFIRSGWLNICLILVSVFILVSARDEQDAYLESTAKNLSPRADRPMPVRFFQMQTDSTIFDALRLMRPGEAGWFLLYNKEKKPAGLLDGSAVADFLRSGGTSDTELGKLPFMYFRQG